MMSLTENDESLVSDLNVVKLPHDAFRKALAEGRGEALMHVVAYGLDGVEQLVLKACLEEQAYDAQCEGHRAAWLYRMFRDAPNYDRFSRKIIAELREMSDESSAEQLCALAGMMAVDGDGQVKAALRSFVWGQDFTSGNSVSGCHAIALVDGPDALREIARRYGRALTVYPHAFVDSLDDLTDGPQACERAFADLVQLAQTDADIAVYVLREQHEIDERAVETREGPARKAARRERHGLDFLAAFPLDAVIAAAVRHERSRGNFVRFGRWCDDTALVALLARLDEETDPEACLRLLWVFRYATPPFIPACLWRFAVHPDSRLRDAALTALSHVTDPAVGAFARQFLAQRPFGADDAAVIELFTNNYQSGDEDLILSVLNGLPPDGGDDDAHAIGMSIRTFCKSDHLPATAGILHWMVKTNPCTLCRGDVVRHLVEANCLAPEVALESRFDASDAVRELTK